jgi:hypothetical protein
VPVAIAGKTESVHTIITSKPGPSPNDTLGVIVELLLFPNVSILPPLNVSTVLVSDPKNVTRFIAIHTFEVLLDIDEDIRGATLRFEFTQPPNWMSLDLLVPLVVVPVVIGEKINFSGMHIICLS